MRPETFATLVAIAKNEGPYLIEWIAYHKVVGFDRIVIYDNESDDDSPDMLQALASAGEVDYVPWPWSDAYQTGPQIPAYRDSLRRLSGTTEWLCVLDCDEFLTLKKHRSVQDLIESYPLVDAIAIHWRLFGSSGHQAKTPGLVMERFTRAAAKGNPSERHIKSMAKLDLIADVPSPHVFRMKDGSRYVTEDMKEAKFSSLQDNPTHNVVQVNHYYTKSREEWSLKRARGKADAASNAPDRFRADEEFLRGDQNAEEETTILAAIQSVKVEMCRLQRITSL